MVIIECDVKCWCFNPYTMWALALQMEMGPFVKNLEVLRHIDDLWINSSLYRLCLAFRRALYLARPLLFLIYINDIGLNIKFRIRLFADDTLLYATVSSEDDANTLQQDLESLVAWTTLWQVSLNRGKCKILNVYRSKNPIIHQYTMNRVHLDTVTHHPYLGVELSSNLNWSFHI